MSQAVQRPRVRRLSATLLMVALFVALLPTSAANAQPSNDVVISEIFYNPDGQAEGHEFIELHNTTSTAIDLSGWQFLTGITFTFPAGSTIDANSYIVLAQNSADFATVFGFAPTGDYSGALNNAGESLLLVDATNTVADQVIYDDVSPWPLSADGSGDSLVSIDASLAPNDPARWVAGSPTPQVANDPVLDVIFSVQRGWYSSTQTVTLTPSIPGADIFYNTSGSGVATTLYTGPITVGDNNDIRVLQARASLNGQGSNLSTHTYVFKPDAGAPLIATWPNGRAVAPDEDEVTRSFEFIPPPSTGLVASWANAGVKASAGGIAAGESDKFFFRGAYGNSTLTADMFGDNFYGIQPTTDVDQLFLRNNQGDATHLRQIFAHDALLELGQLSPHGRFVEYYKSGVDSGVRHMQERPEGGFMESYTGIDKDNWLAWSTNELTPGSGTPNGLGGETMGAPYSSWADAQQSVNTESLIDYLLVQWQAKVSDYRNLKNFRTAGPVDFNNGTTDFQGTGGDYRYHFFNWDLDLGYNNNQYGRGNPEGWGWAGYTSPDYLAHDLDGFIEFRLQASDRIACAHFDGGPLTAAAFAPRLDARRQELIAAGGANSQSFVSSLGPWIADRNTWLIDEYRSAGADRTVYGVNRPDTAPWKPPSNFTGPLLQADDPVGVSISNGVLSISNPNGGSVYYRTDGGDPRTADGLQSPQAVLYNGPVGLLSGRHEIIARSFDPNANDTFQAWSPGCNEPEIVDVAVSGNPGASPGEGIVITELHYNPAPIADPDGNSFEYLELFNSTDAPINLSGFSFGAGVEYTFAPGTVLASGGYYIVAANAVAFAVDHGFAPDAQYSGRLNDGGETITLVDAVGAIVDTVTYDDVAPWPTEADKTGLSLSLLSPELDNSVADSWAVSRDLYGSPGQPNEVASKGDVNCDSKVDLLDALIISQYTVGLRTNAQTCALSVPVSELNLSFGDMNSDGQINVIDSLLIAQCRAGLDNGYCDLALDGLYTEN